MTGAGPRVGGRLGEGGDGQERKGEEGDGEEDDGDGLDPLRPRKAPRVLLDGGTRRGARLIERWSEVQQ